VFPIGKLIVPAALVTALTVPASAQVPGQQGFFGHIDGRWMWLGGDRISGTGGTVPVTSGPGGQMLIGYRFTPQWDVALAGDVQGLLATLTQFRNGTLSVDTNHQHFDLEAGYTSGWWRVNAGLRGIHYRQGAAYSIPGAAGSDQREMYGIGPKIGMGLRVPVSASWAVLAGADAALLYTSFADTGGGVLLDNASYWQIVPQLSGELGVSWRSTESPSLSFTTGARIATSFSTAITSGGSRQGSLVEFGPFVRMAYNFAGPSRSQRMAVREEREIWTNSPPTGTERYVVHFDYERSGIGLMASAVIRQAAEDIRRGRPANIAVASTDVDIGSEYSRALSRRRAEAIRNALAKEGIPPSQVDVAIAGEVPPLAPGPGGVQEARNRRAQITF
jgi:outer membrane protein OmpA-like peptidoglycan-associated protein